MKIINLNRSVIAVSGEDAAVFLQGIISNDINILNAEKALYTYLLTPQGKYLFDFFITKNNDEYLIDIAKEDASDFLKRIKIYKLRSKVQLEDKSEEYNVYSAPELSGEDNNFIWFKDSRASNLGCRIILKANHDLVGFGKAFTESFNAQIKMFPNMLNNKILNKINLYKDKCIGYKISGAGGGGYLILVSDKEIKNSVRIKIRRNNY